MMTRLARTITLAITTAMLLASGPADANSREIWIASGLPGGTYRSVYATNLERLMPGYKIYYRQSSGSAENLALLTAGQADVAFAQADVYAELLGEDPDRYGKIQVLGRLADECVYIAHQREGAVVELPQLGAAKAAGGFPKIAVGDALGGMSGTWRFMVKLDPALANTKVEHAGDTLALNQLAVGQFDAVAWVTDPHNYDHKLLRATLANESLALMKLKSPQLVVALPDGTQVYRARSVKLKDSWKSPRLETICTSALLFARGDADPKLTGKLADILSLELGRVVPAK